MSDFLTALQISGSGLSVQRTRLDVAASNLANAESTRGPDGQPYRRHEAVIGAVPFEAELGDAGAKGSSITQGVEVTKIVEDPTPGKRVYLPGHPDADPDGFVTFPNVNPVHETVNLISASRGYEANATAVETLKSMAQRALDISR
ncbi:MAG: flagellar basal body rod protein FlgC [Myxococcaceae bacterium]